MESITRYNVIMVHGAANESSGFENKCNGHVSDAATQLKDKNDNPEDTTISWSLGGAAGMIGGYHARKRISNWLDSAIFEDYVYRNGKPFVADSLGSPYIYIQRSFLNPAGSPYENANEIGNPKWYGPNNCSVRRSLIEEAQEVRAGGQQILAEMRKKGTFREVPSRNILIGHSMGGVAIREYVQGDFYNNDVDKIITLDSPHEGTGSLNLLLDMDNLGRRSFEALTTTITLSSFFLAVGKDLGTIDAALLGLSASFGFAGMNYGLGQLILGSLDGFDYKEGDPLVSYIDPNGDASHNVKDLQKRPYQESFPMMRLLGGKNSMVFTDPNAGWRNPVSFFVPDALTVPFANLFTHVTGNETVSANFVNSVTGFLSGYYAGITVQDHGTALIPSWSGMASSTDALNNPNTDIYRIQYDGAITANNTSDMAQTAIAWTIVGSAIIALDVALSSFPQVAAAAKVALGYTGAAFLGAGLASATLVGVDDLKISHEAPVLSEYQKKWKGRINTFSMINGLNRSITPYLMEDFLYEKPFVTLRVTSKNDILESTDPTYATNKDSVGLCKIVAGECQSLSVIAPDQTKGQPLTFKKTGDWEKMGVKKDTWTRVPGVDGTVPIRHVDRYAVPNLVVQDWIERYRFVVDDLMPSRLRQIRINFNFQEDLGWECDITKPENDSNACDLYQRTSDGKGWIGPVKKVPHPVKKDGTFDLDVKAYYSNLLAIQKDNQNTITISTVNKIGLSNTQRFSYLFKATSNLLQPRWPLPGVVVSQIDSFSTYASTLDYQDFSVQSGMDRIVVDNVDSQPKAPFVQMRKTPVASKDGWDLASTLKNTSIQSSRLRWNVKIISGNGSVIDTTEENIAFQVDQQAPQIYLASESAILNPDSSMFMARFRNDTSIDNSLRLVRMKLERISHSAVDSTIHLPLIYDVINPEFGVGWTGVDRTKLKDGEYRLTALAIDNAVPHRNLYDAVNHVVSKADLSTGSTEFSAAWDSIAATPGSWQLRSGLNAATTSASFVVDRSAPMAAITKLTAQETSVDKPLYGASTKAGWLILNQDQTLQASYSIKEPLLGRDSTPVAMVWRFRSHLDTNKAHQAGDSVWIHSEQAVEGTWTEWSQMRIPEGDYHVQLVTRDAAGNIGRQIAGTQVRIDRTAPRISELVSKQLVYADTSAKYTATLYVSQADDQDSNKTDLSCYYRVSGAGIVNSAWTLIGTEKTSKLKTDDSPVAIYFTMDKSLVGSVVGKRYLEAGCIDGAGNFGARTDLFHVGALSPTIVSPDSTVELENEVVVIRGLAPVPTGVGQEGAAGYRIRWRKLDNANWQTQGMDVGAGKRVAASTPWLSNEAQPVEGDLALWNRSTLPAGEYVLELASRACEACAWVTDSMNVVLGNTIADTASSQLVLSAPASVVAGNANAKLSMRVESATGLEFRGRLYAQDAEGNALFEVSSEKLTHSPYEGEPQTPGTTDGIWFWSASGQYHLQWKGLPSGKRMTINYQNGSVDSLCRDQANAVVHGCSVVDSVIAVANINMDSIMQSMGVVYLDELKIPAGLNKAMVLSQSAGHIVFRATLPFRMDLMELMDTTGSMVLPYWLGSSSTQGLTIGGNTIPSMSFTVDPSLYGLRTTWNGLSRTGQYPKGGLVTLYAEAIGNELNGNVIRDSLTMQVTLPNLELVSAEESPMADYYVIQQSGGSVTLGNKSMKYGVRGRDAVVNAWVQNASGNVVRRLLTNEPQNAAMATGAYTLEWSGLDSLGHPVTSAGAYTFVIQAKERNGSQTAELQRAFNLSVAPGMSEMVDGGVDGNMQSALHVAEAVDDPNYLDQFLYSPKADYLVRATVSGMTLPDSLRTVVLQHSVSGTQVAQGYPAQRFSLAVKRKREQLDLAIVYRIRAHQKSHRWANDIRRPCQWYDSHETQYFGSFIKSFTNSNRSSEISIDVTRHSDYGFDQDQPAYLDVWAVLLKDYNNLTGAGAVDGIVNNSLIPVWKKTVLIPNRDDNSVQNLLATTDSRCSAEGKDDVDAKPCTINADGSTTNGYDPNANLFSLKSMPNGEDGYFFDNRGKLFDTNCGKTLPRSINIKVRMTIPNEYWDAGYGYDNLVNRTIRFDQTNTTIFGEGSGFLAALDSLGKTNPTYADYRNIIFYDGSQWKPNKTYGLLTPFEVHNFPFPNAKILSGGVNTFLFPDEDPNHMYPSYFFSKFYGTNQLGNFRATILGLPADGATCKGEVDSDGRCKTVLQTTNGGTSSEVATQLLKHGTVNVMVSLDAKPEDFTANKVQVAYPANANWRSSLSIGEKSIQCPASTNFDWPKVTSAITTCGKFYDAGSMVHYYLDDFSNRDWNMALRLDDGSGVLKNAMNSSSHPDVNNIYSVFDLNVAAVGNGKDLSLDTVSFRSNFFQNGKYYIPEALLGKPKPPVSAMNATVTTTVLGVDSKDVAWNATSKRLEAPAREWTDPALSSNQIVYRRAFGNTTEDAIPIATRNTDLTLEQLYIGQQNIQNRVNARMSLFTYNSSTKQWMPNEWIRDVSLSNPLVTQLDSGSHTHFVAALGANDEKPSVVLSRKARPDSTRPAELVAVQGRVPGAGTKYQLSYVKDNVFHTIKTGVMGNARGTLSQPPFISWFDVNRLQGNTSLLLSWGGVEGKALNFRKLDLNIGSPQGDGNSSEKTVKSLFGELSVHFPQSSLNERTDVTVRTVEPSEYNFTTFNNATLRGPVMEVLPSMVFPEGSYPRVKMQIARASLSAEQQQDPTRIRLYKVDFVNKQFVPLQKILYGFLGVDGEAKGVSQECENWKEKKCYGDGNWEYLLVSGETRTFSEFVALDHITLPQGDIGLTVSPMMGTGLQREIQVTGTTEFNLYIDNDSLWADSGDASAPSLLTVSVDSAGHSLITLPNRMDSWLYLVAKQNGTELASAPVRVHVQVVPPTMVCQVSDSLLWLGLDNGYLELAQSCNQGGMGSLQLRKSGNVMAEIHRTLPDTIRWEGRVGMNKIAFGTYTTRYLGVAVTGAEEQQVGPVVRTDSLRPTITDWSVLESSALLDRRYSISAKVRDELSGLAKVSMTWKLGSAVLGNVHLTPNEDGHIAHSLTISRAELLSCSGCKVSVALHVEDYGHNYADTAWTSDKVWPYPLGLSLWYPAQEGSGSQAQEKLGTGHDLALSMYSPWQSASGLYFNKMTDKAVGKGSVDLGQTEAYSLEAWVRPGYVGGTEWKRLLGFTSIDGQSMEWQLQGANVRLVDGDNVWTASDLLTQAKVWTHLVVTVDSTQVHFYKDGRLVYSGLGSPAIRELNGTFSLGTGHVTSFVGHVSQVRLYKKALTAEEARALFLDVGSTGEVHTEIVLANSLTEGAGVQRDFSCSAPGSNYWTAQIGGGLLTWNAWVDQSGSYKAIVYARSSHAGTQSMSIGLAKQSLQSGNVNLETVWRPLTIEGVTLSLSAGYNNLKIQLPEGMQLAGIAITDDPLAMASRITWNSTSQTSVTESMSAQLKLEGYPDATMVRPRIRLTNTGKSTVSGFSVRYYFRGEDPSQVQPWAFYPQDATMLSVHQETERMGYAEWKFPEESVAPGQTPFWGEGPHFGLSNTSYTPWVFDDDPSFVANAASSYVAAPGIVVLDASNQVLTGSCFEDENAVSSTPKVQIAARDSRAGDGQASQLYIKLENIGQVALKDYEVRYSYYVPNGIVPEFDVYDMQELSATQTSLGAGRWQISIRGSRSIGPGTSWANPAQFALHLPGWKAGWNASDDPSHTGLTSDWAVATGIEVFDSQGNRIYGTAPVWPTVIVDGSSSSGAASTSAQVRVMAKETKTSEANASSVRLFVENLGTQSLDNFEMRYWFTQETGKTVDHQVYNNSATVSKIAEGGNLYSMRFKYSGVPLAPGQKTEWGDGLELFLHYSDWSLWNKDKDFSHTGVGTTFKEANYVALYDGNGKLVWGTEPVIPDISTPPAIEISKTSEGVVLHLLQSAQVRVDLVNVAGMPVRFVYSGTLSAGDQLIALDWSGIDLNNTYLMVRLNGQIVASKLLSQI